MNSKRILIGLVVGCLILIGSILVVAANDSAGPADPVMLAGGLNGTTGMGSTIGPGRALYVTEAAAGKISRIDPKTGDITAFATGLPQGNPAIGIGGVMDVAFVDDTAYALVTLVGADVGGSDVVGIYRVDGPGSSTVIADIGQFAIDHPPSTAFDVPTGVQYALETYRDGFLVADGHHNRVLQVTLAGQISVLLAVGNAVPTGLAVQGSRIYMAEAGAVPHLPEDGRVVVFDANSTTPTDVASGARLLVDVELGRRNAIFALSQGIWDGAGPGSPAEPNTGQLVVANEDGTFTVVADALDRPTSLEFIRSTAFYVTLGGEVWMIEGAAN